MQIKVVERRMTRWQPPRGAINARALIYPMLGAVAVYAAYAIYVAWPRPQVSELALMDAAGHRQLAALRAQARVAPSPESFRAPRPFVIPSVTGDVTQVEHRADAGDNDARCALARHFAEDKAPDYGEARKWLMPAVAAHNGCAINMLGNMYKLGYGTAPDPATALSYYRAAASVGYPGAYYNLGHSYENGEGVQPNDHLAFQWYLKSANAGYESAFDPVAGYYASGDGGVADRFLAERWYELAAKSGEAYAKECLAQLYLADSTLPNHFALALRWLRDDQHSPWSQYAIGLMYQRGEGVAKNDREAARWYVLASVGHFGPAESAYAGMLQTGAVGGKRDVAAAAKYYKAAAKDGDALGMYQLGLMAQAGTGVPRDYPLAERLFGAAALLGNSDAMMLIADRFNTGTHGYPRDTVRAQALAIVAQMYGADPQAVAKIAQPRAPADPSQVLRLVDQYQREIDANTGNAHPSSGAGMPPVPTSPN